MERSLAVSQLSGIGNNYNRNLEDRITSKVKLEIRSSIHVGMRRKVWKANRKEIERVYSKKTEKAF